MITCLCLSWQVAQLGCESRPSYSNPYGPATVIGSLTSGSHAVQSWQIMSAILNSHIFTSSLNHTLHSHLFPPSVPYSLLVAIIPEEGKESPGPEPSFAWEAGESPSRPCTGSLITWSCSEESLHLSPPHRRGHWFSSWREGVGLGRCVQAAQRDVCASPPCHPFPLSWCPAPLTSDAQSHTAASPIPRLPWDPVSKIPATAIRPAKSVALELEKREAGSEGGGQERQTDSGSPESPLSIPSRTPYI